MPAKFATYPSLVGQTVFITGGASGIGAEIVAAFAAQGAGRLIRTVLSDGFERVSVCRQFPEFMPKKAGATRRGRRRGSA